MRAWAITWVMALWNVSAQAQEAGSDQELPGDPGTMESFLPDLVPVALEYAEGWHWAPTGPHLPRTPRFVALSTPGEGSLQVMAMDGRGGVWRSHDGAHEWRRVLVAPRDKESEEKSDEEMLLDAEVLTGDLPDFEELFETEFEEFEGELEEALGGLESSRDSIDALDLQDQIQGSTTLDSVWFRGSLSHSPQEWMVVLAARSDGIWRSADAGQSFVRTDEGSQVASFAWGGLDVVVGSTSVGLVISVDGGRTWEPCQGVGRDFAVYAVVHDQASGWWAASEGGLLQSRDGLRWRFAASSTGLVGSSLTAIGVQGDSIWVATDNRILRSDDQGATFAPSSSQHLPGIQVIRPGAVPGALLIATADGVWQSLDGGYRWRPVSTGLHQPLMWDVVGVPSSVILASEDGLYRLVKDGPVIQESKKSASELRSPPLGPLVDAALRRPGVDPANAGLDTNRSAVSRLLPEFNLDLQIVDRTNLSVDFTDRSNALDTDMDWRLMAHLSWGQGSESDPASSALANAEFSDLYYVLRGEVYAAGEESSVLTAASRLTTGSSQYRVQLSELVAQLYYSRERLARSVEVGSSGDLQQDVHRQLDLQELTARIDAYTEGALSRALQGS